MKAAYTNLLKYPVREALDELPLKEIDVVQELLDDYSGLIHIGGEPACGMLGTVYCMARENACDRAVLAFFEAIDELDTAKKLANGVFLDLAAAQKCKLLFEKRIKEALSPRPIAGCAGNNGGRLSESAVEDMLSELDLEVRLNLVTKKPEVNGGGAPLLIEKYSRDNIVSALPTVLYDYAREKGLRMNSGGLSMIKAYLFNLANANRYNPITDMLISHENTDETSLLKIYDMLGLQTAQQKTLVRKWLIQTVAFAFADVENPVSCEGVLVLQGKQGICKTSFFRKLAGDPMWFTEGAVIDMRNKDTLLTAISGWICELGEIDSTFKKDQSALKGFITRTIDRIRLPYAPADSDMPRTTSMCGTVNPEQFLKDNTGNRRYWTIHVDNIDRGALFSMSKEDVFHLWGYVYSLYKQNPESYRLTESENELLNACNHDFTVTLPFEDEIKQFLDFTQPVEDWLWHSPAEIAAYFPRVTAEQVGRVFSKIADEERDVTMRKTMTSNKYLLPIDLSKPEFKTNNYHVG